MPGPPLPAILAVGLLSYLNPETLLEAVGGVALWVAAGIIFAECGLLVGFFLPGDSLLFVVGLFVGNGAIDQPIVLVCAVLFVAALAGNIVGYWVGYKAGPTLFRRKDSRLFKQEYVESTERFFARYGGMAIILARFVPIARTFITAMAGVGRMDFRRYLLFSTIGALLWAVGLTLIGYLFGNVPWIKNNLEITIIVIVLASVVPVAIHRLLDRRRAHP
ncbi:MAG: DedA family protein [Actinomycetota bacterium]